MYYHLKYYNVNWYVNYRRCRTLEEALRQRDNEVPFMNGTALEIRDSDGNICWQSPALRKEGQCEEKHIDTGNSVQCVDQR